MRTTGSVVVVANLGTAKADTSWRGIAWVEHEYVAICLAEYMARLIGTAERLAFSWAIPSDTSHWLLAEEQAAAQCEYAEISFGVQYSDDDYLQLEPDEVLELTPPDFRLHVIAVRKQISLAATSAEFLKSSAEQIRSRLQSTGDSPVAKTLQSRPDDWLPQSRPLTEYAQIKVPKKVARSRVPRGTYLYMDSGQGLEFPLDPSGWLFHSNDSELADQVADVMAPEVRAAHGILNVFDADDVFQHADEALTMIAEALQEDSTFGDLARRAKRLAKQIRLKDKRDRKRRPEAPLEYQSPSGDIAEHPSASALSPPAESAPLKRTVDPNHPTMNDLATAAGISDDTFRRVRDKAGIVVREKGAAARFRRYVPTEVDSLIAAALAGDFAERRGMAEKWAKWGTNAMAKPQEGI